VVRQNVAIYVDTLAPRLDRHRAHQLERFDQRLYPLDTAAFGRQSDIDNNAVVLMLMTNVVSGWSLRRSA
jgi:hypothetical protein